MIGVRLKSLIMEAGKVTKAVKSTTERVFNKFGAFVMTRARRSIRKAPRSKLVVIPGRLRLKRVKTTEAEQVAPPGAQPYAHKGNTLARFIRFAFDPGRQSVVIGPEKLPGKIGDAPASLEKGGPSQAMRGAKRLLKATRVRPHPFMLPALQAELPKLPGMWKDQVRP